MEDSERRDTVRPHASRAVSLVLAVKRDILVAASGARCPILYSFAKTLLDISYRYTNHQLKDESPVFGFGSLLKCPALLAAHSALHAFASSLHGFASSLPILPSHSSF